MGWTCPVCATTPGSHSLREIGMEEGCVVFYTCPAEASKYNDYPGILAHYENTLESRVGSDKPWIWVFDCSGFTLKHLVEVNVATGVASLINDKFEKNLQKIVIVNAYWIVHVVLRIVGPFISKSLREKIKFTDYCIEELGNGRPRDDVSA